MEYVQVVCSAALSVLALLILTRLLGHRQMSQLSMFDYINGITIGSIAAEAATLQEDSLIKPLLAMTVYAVLTLLLSLLNDSSLKARRVITGEPVILYRNGVLFDKTFRRAHINVNEFLMKCRGAGYFDLSQLSLAILEPNGQISFLPMSASRPLTPADMRLDPAQEAMPANVILDGAVQDKNLASAGHNRDWLARALQKSGQSAESVFLATLTADGQLNTYPRGGDAGRDTLT